MISKLPGRVPIVAALLLAGFITPAPASTIVGVEALQTWNMIVFGDVRSSDRTEGRSFIGGNLDTDGARFYTGSDRGSGEVDPKTADPKTGETREPQHKELEGGGFVQDGKDPPKSSGVTELIVGGNVSGKSGLELRNGGSASIGGDLETQLGLDDKATALVGGSLARQEDRDGSYEADLGKDFTATINKQAELLRASMADLSASLALLKPTGEIGGGDVLSIKAGEGLNIFNFSLDMFRDAKALSVSAADGSTIVINVAGTSGVIGADFREDSNNLGRNVIWNFYEASDLVFDSAFLGTVLAPGALVTSNNHLEGTLVAAGFNQNGALRSAGFQGNLVAAPGGDGGGGAVVSVAPEPESWAMLILGVALIGAALRRRDRRTIFVQAA